MIEAPNPIWQARLRKRQSLIAGVKTNQLAHTKHRVCSETHVDSTATKDTKSESGTNAAIVTSLSGTETSQVPGRFSDLKKTLERLSSRELETSPERAS